MTTTVTVLADGGTLRLTTVDTAGWGTLVFDDTKSLQVLVASGGAAERTLDAIIERPGSGAANQGVELLANPAITTTSIANDTLAVDFVFTGDAHGHPDHNRIYSGEAVEIVVCDAGIVTSGSNATEALAAAIAVTNNSTATKPSPYGWVVSDTHNTKQSGTFDVWIDVLSKHGVALVECSLTDGTTTITESATARTTVTTRPQQNVNGLYCPGATVLDVYKFTFDAADFAANILGTLNFEITDNIGTTYDSAAGDTRVKDRKIFLDKTNASPDQHVYVNCHATVDISGETGGTIAAGDRIKGATSNALGYVVSRVSNTLTYIWYSTLSITSGETINVVNAGQTSTGVSATAASNGTRVVTGGTIGNPAAPYPSIQDALHAVRAANSAAGRTANYDGAIVHCQTHIQGSHYGSLFGYTNPPVGRYSLVIQPDEDEPNGYTPKVIGGNSGAWREGYKLIEFRDLVFEQIFTAHTWHFVFGSSDDPQIKLLRCTRTSGGIAQNPFYMQAIECSSEAGAINAGGVATNEAGFLMRDCVCLSLDEVERDFVIFSATQGYSYCGNVYCAGYAGSVAGNHSDIFQTVDATEPFLCHNIIARDIRYQFLFIGGATSNRCKGFGIVNCIIEMSDDEDMGSQPLAIDQATLGPVVFANITVVASNDSGATFRGAALSGNALELSEMRLSNCFLGAVSNYAPQSPNIRVAAHNCHVLGTTDTGMRSSKSTSIDALLTDVTTNDFEYPSASNWTSGTPYKRTWDLLERDNVDGLLTDVYGDLLFVPNSGSNPGKIINPIMRPIIRPIARGIVG